VGEVKPRPIIRAALKVGAEVRVVESTPLIGARSPGVTMWVNGDLVLPTEQRQTSQPLVVISWPTDRPDEEIVWWLVGEHAVDVAKEMLADAS
jgi:hypothetical protein